VFGRIVSQLFEDQRGDRLWGVGGAVELEGGLGTTLDSVSKNTTDGVVSWLSTLRHTAGWPLSLT
jgi:hypothetical protein